MDCSRLIVPEYTDRGPYGLVGNVDDRACRRLLGGCTTGMVGYVRLLARGPGIDASGVPVGARPCSIADECDALGQPEPHASVPEFDHGDFGQCRVLGANVSRRHELFRHSVLSCLQQLVNGDSGAIWNIAYGVSGRLGYWTGMIAWNYMFFAHDFCLSRLFVFLSHRPATVHILSRACFRRTSTSPWPLVPTSDRYECLRPMFACTCPQRSALDGCLYQRESYCSRSVGNYDM